MIGSIYVQLHMTLLHTKYTNFDSCGFIEDVFMYFHYKLMADNDFPKAMEANDPREWPFLTLGT